MGTLETFEINRRVIEDFTSRTLAAVPTELARLCYLASLRDASGRYVHDGLTSLYPDGAVQAALSYCHGEIFARILEMPLEQQEWDLRACLADMEGGAWETRARWREQKTYRSLAPEGQPAYLRELFASNVRTLLDVLAERPTWRSAA